MNRLLLDANMPRGLRAMLSGFAVETADRNIRYQQNLTGRRIALIELTTSHWETIRDNIDDILAAVEAAIPGGYTTVTLPRPPKRRRVYDGAS